MLDSRLLFCGAHGPAVEFLSDYGLFMAKTVTLVVAVIVVIAFAVAASARFKSQAKEHIEIKNLNRKFEAMADSLEAAILPKKRLKQKRKQKKQQHKAEAKQTRDADDGARKRLYVLDFHGDIRASAVASLREEVTALLTVARQSDEVLVRLESAGGMVHAYGLAASQLARIRQKKIPLTVAVDKVAASGGYLMACVADRIIAGPFAIVGSIGVLAQIPNFHRLLKSHDVDFEQFMAGEYKRTVTLFGETTDKARDKLMQDIEDTHALFKEFVDSHRPGLDLEKISTGEHWHGTRAIELKLIDEIRTSDDYLLAASADSDLYEVTYTSKKTLTEKLSSIMRGSLKAPEPGLRAELDLGRLPQA